MDYNCSLKKYYKKNVLDFQRISNRLFFKISPNIDGNFSILIWDHELLMLKYVDFGPKNKKKAK